MADSLCGRAETNTHCKAIPLQFLKNQSKQQPPKKQKQQQKTVFGVLSGGGNL